jgi:ribosomal protein L6P/L9E
MSTSVVGYGNLKKNIINYIIPHRWNCVVIYNLRKKSYYLNIYSNIYYFIIPITTQKTLLNFDLSTNQLWVQSSYSNNFSLLYTKIIHTIYQSFIKPYFRKIKFKGKGYYIYKNYRNTITPQFGYSHRLYLYGFYLNVVFLSKTSLIVFGLNVSHVSYVSSKLLKWRPVNIFTGRGIRFSKQLIYKKSGKVSTYR